MQPCIIDRPLGTGPLGMEDWLLMFFHIPVVVKIKGKILPVKENTLLVWQPGSYQYYGNPDNPYLHSWIHCNGTLVRHLANTCGTPLDTPIANMSCIHFERHIESIHFEHSQFVEPEKRIVENHLRNLFYDIQRFAKRGTEVRLVPTAFREVRHFIESNYSRAITLKELARMANLSVSRFCAEFKEIYGTSAIDYLIRYRLSEAMRLLRDSNVRIGEIAPRVGVEDIFYFSKLIKKHYGLSPRQLRRKLTSS